MQRVASAGTVSRPCAEPAQSRPATASSSQTRRRALLLAPALLSVPAAWAKDPEATRKACALTLALYGLHCTLRQLKLLVDNADQAAMLRKAHDLQRTVLALISKAAELRAGCAGRRRGGTSSRRRRWRRRTARPLTSRSPALPGRTTIGAWRSRAARRSSVHLRATTSASTPCRAVSNQSERFLRLQLRQFYVESQRA